MCVVCVCVFSLLVTDICAQINLHQQRFALYPHASVYHQELQFSNLALSVLLKDAFETRSWLLLADRTKFFSKVTFTGVSEASRDVSHWLRRVRDLYVCASDPRAGIEPSYPPIGIRYRCTLTLMKLCSFTDEKNRSRPSAARLSLRSPWYASSCLLC